MAHRKATQRVHGSILPSPRVVASLAYWPRRLDCFQSVGLLKGDMGIANTDPSSFCRRHIAREVAHAGETILVGEAETMGNLGGLALQCLVFGLGEKDNLFIVAKYE